MCSVYVIHVQDACSEADMVSEDRTPHVAVAGDPYATSSFYVIIEGEIVARCETFPAAIHNLFMLFYVLNLEYPAGKKHPVQFFTFCQKILFQLDVSKLSAKLTSVVSSLARLK
jgi:hypothetical protein